jgi:hypothetical protein
MSEMNNGRQTVPGDGWIPGCFAANRNKFPLEQLIPYAGKYVAWSLDGTRIIASGADYDEIFAELDRQGIPSAHYVIAYIDPLL